MSDVIFLVLGCFGRRDNKFVSCAGVENRILKVTTALEHYNEAMDYFDSCRLFDRPMFEMQAIRHFIFNMQDRFDQIGAGKRLWPEHRCRFLAPGELLLEKQVVLPLVFSS